MNMVLAFLPPHRIDEVALRLQRLDHFPGMTVTDARGYGDEEALEERDAQAQLTDFTPTARIEMVLPEGLVEEVLSAIYEVAHTGRPGDGNVYVLTVADALRIETGQRGASAV